MASTSSSSSSRTKSKSKTASTSTFLELKAEIARQKEELAKARAAGVPRARPSGVTGAFGEKKGDKKISQWTRQNKGVTSRNARDIVELEAVSKPTLENARAALERKAKLYDKLKKGKTGGLTDKQYDSLLVDFDQRRSDDDYESDSEDEDESRTVPRPPENDADDPLVEYEDEFGRMRTARQSEVPRHLARKEDDEPKENEPDPFAIYGDQGHFPVYEPTAERLAEIEEAYLEATKDPTQHYDASGDNRAKGAGFYQFSADEEERKRQMEALRREREETERKRREAGIDEGEGEGGDDDGEEIGPQPMGQRSGEGDAFEKVEAVAAPRITGRGIDKRKRELEERRAAIEAKRRKLKPGVSSGDNSRPSGLGLGSASALKSTAQSKTNTAMDADEFLQGLEADILGRSNAS